MKTCRFLLCLFTGLLLSTISARANVFASDIRLNGNLTSFTGSGPVTITYHLNQPATLGVKIAVIQGSAKQGTTNVVTLTGGTAMGLNTVVWGATNSAGTVLSNGTFSVKITAAATGFTTWQQISLDSNPGMTAYYPLGIAVNNNSNSPYYGRVVMGCAVEGTGPSEKVGLYKMNADGTQADEGWYGNAGYTNDDGGTPFVAGQMPSFPGYIYDPMKVRIGDDDRIYWLDNSYYGAIIATDMEATTNQVVIAATIGGAHNYQNNPALDSGQIELGFQQFDVTGTTTTNAALWFCDSDFPSAGIWLFHLINGASDTTDQYGVQVVQTGNDLSEVASGGCTVDTNLDIFVGQYLPGEDAAYRAMQFTNWNGGVLPPPDTNGASAYTYALGTTPGEVVWGFDCGVGTLCTNDTTFEAVNDVVINSRLNPTLVACPMSKGNNNGNGGGIRVLNATNGSVITVTNGAVVQALTNIDWGHAYTCAAWDNVGNLYAASTNLNLWRVWSPPGGSTNTTVSAATVLLSTNVVTGPSNIKVTSVTRVGTTLTIAFTAPASDPVSSFTLQSATTLKGSYATVSGATFTGSAGAFTASTSTPATTEFYRIKQ
jgi:hypothetical protein